MNMIDCFMHEFAFLSNYATLRQSIEVFQDKIGK